MNIDNSYHSEGVLAMKLKNNGEQGFVLASIISISFALTIIVASIVAISMTETRLSARADAVNTARDGTEALTNELYALLLKTNVEGLEQTLAGRSYNPTIDHQGWYKYSPVLGWEHCGDQDYRLTCYRVAKIKTTSSQADGSGIDSARVEFLIETVSRSKCNSMPVAGEKGSCIYTRSQVKFRERQFFDNLVMSETELLAPALYPNTEGKYTPANAANNCNPQANKFTGLNCLYSKYQSRSSSGSNAGVKDVVNGPIHTNDEHIYVCSRTGQKVEFSGRVSSVPSTGQPVFKKQNPTICGDETEGATTKVLTSPLKLPTATATLKNKAAQDGSQYDVVGNATIYLGGGASSPAVQINGTSFPYPSNGVIYVQGDVTVQGTVNGGLTIYSTKTIKIIGNIVYADKVLNSTDDDGFEYSNDVLGLIAQKDIEITCAVGVRCPVRNVDAVMLAIDGIIGNPNWKNSPVGTSPPKLTVFGSMSSYYRGTFGSISSLDGSFKHGWVKNFQYDERLSSLQPPNFLRPVNATWSKSGFTEIVCDNYCWSKNWNWNK
jgi:hypothetical protein